MKGIACSKSIRNSTSQGASMLNKQNIHCIGARVQIVCKVASQEDEESLVEKIRLCRINNTGFP